jgi:outer membrane protein OmpA-like peptidoglycan-associated protein
LFLSNKIGDELTMPVNMGPQINSAAWESQPSLAADGRTLYFVSDRRGGEGNRDIYFAYLLDDGKWTKAENIGDIINTPLDEISPFIHANGRTLYFTSNGRPGFGGYDIYRIERVNGQWTVPENYGSPVNTYEDQFSFFITANGEKGYYSHEEGFNQNTTKIYEVVIPDEMREKFRGGVVRGVVRDKTTKKLLKASVELFDLAAGELVAKVSSDSVSGKYMIVLPEGFEYALYVNRPGYLFQSLHFNDERQGSDAVVIDIDLDPVKVGASVILNNIFFETDRYDLKQKSLTELDKVVRFLKASTGVKIEVAGHTDNVGTEEYNKQLSLKRADAVAGYLVRNGVKEEQVTKRGYGASNPIRPNDSDENRSFNRRIEIRVIHH